MYGVLLYCLFFTLLVIFYGYRIVANVKLRSVPGPKQSWLFGNLLSLKHIAKDLTAWAKIYGPVYKIFMGGRPMIVVTDPEMARKVFMKSHHRPLNIATPPSAGVRRNFQEQSLFWSHGQRFKTLKSAWQVAFNQGSVHNYFTLMERQANQFCNFLEKQSQIGQSFNIYPEIQKMTLQVVGTTAFGIDFGLFTNNDHENIDQANNYQKNIESDNKNSNTNNNNDLTTSTKKNQENFSDNNKIIDQANLNNIERSYNDNNSKIIDQANKNNNNEGILNYFGIDPKRLFTNCQKVFMGSQTNSRKQAGAVWAIFNFLFPELRKLWAQLNMYFPLGKLQKEALSSILVTIADSTKIASYQRTKQGSQEGGDKTNVIDPGSFLAKLVKTKDPFSNGQLLNDFQVGSQAQIFMIAGFDTTANCLAFTLYLLCNNPEKKQKLLQEIDNNKHENSLTLETIEKCSYLEAVIKESLRLFPPGPVLPKSIDPEIQLGNYNFPPNSNFFLNIYGIQRDPLIWKNPEEFIPERFLQDSEDFEIDKIHPFAYAPFGGGSRMCIGHRYALQELKLALFKLYQRYDFELVSGQENIQTKVTLTMAPENGLYITVKKR